jgi:hypothetical protein
LFDEAKVSGGGFDWRENKWVVAKNRWHVVVRISRQNYLLRVSNTGDWPWERFLFFNSSQKCPTSSKETSKTQTVNCGGSTGRKIEVTSTESTCILLSSPSDRFGVVWNFSETTTGCRKSDY